MFPSHSKFIQIFSSIGIATLVATSVFAAPPAETAPQPAQVIESNLQRLPLHFEAGAPDSASAVRYVSSGAGYLLETAPAGVRLALDRQVRNASADAGAALWLARGGRRAAGVAFEQHSLSLELLGAARDADVTSFGPTGGHSNYILGNDPGAWRTNVKHYQGVRYSSVYDGIDWVLYGNQRSLEYDFVIAPGADATQIRLRIEGGGGLHVSETGSLLFELGGVRLEQPKPLAYQQIAGNRISVDAEYVLRDGEVSFDIGSYDARYPITVDPVIVFSSYFGGSDRDQIEAMVLDGAGNVVIAGQSKSTNLPSAGNANAGDYDIFVSKINAALNMIMVTTYVGGSGQDIPRDVVLDASENVVLVGDTASSNFPLVFPFSQQGSFGGASDAFLVRLPAAGGAPLNSALLGGSGLEGGFGIAITGSEVWLTGDTGSPNLPTVNPLSQTPTFSGVQFDAWVAHATLGSGSTTLAFSSYFGGNGDDGGLTVDIGSNGNIYVAGETLSTTGGGFPAVNAFQSQNAGGLDGFLICLTPGASPSLTFSSFLGGAKDENIRVLSLTADGKAIVGGFTNSLPPGTPNKFPVVSALQTTFGGGEADAWIGRISNAFTASPSLTFATYWGGSSNDFVTDIAADGQGNFFLTGSTSSTNFPTRDPSQSSYRGGLLDAFYMQVVIGPFPQVISSSFLGGSLADFGRAVAVDSSGNILVAGGTESSNFTVMASLPGQGSRKGVSDGFLTKLSPNCTVTLSGSPALYHGGAQSGAVSVTTSAPGCPWAVTGSSPEITVTTGAGIGNGTITFNLAMNNTGLDRMLSIDAGTASVTITQLGEIGIFSDVFGSDFFFSAVQLMSTLNITDGCSGNPPAYCPNTPITRAQMAVFIVRAKFGGDSFTFSNTPVFTDVPANHQFFKWIQKLAELGITSGCGGGNFCPDLTIPREQAAVFLVRLRYGSTFPFQFPGTALFTDVPQSNMFYNWIQELAETGITTGCGAGIFCPDGPVTRGQMAVFIVRTGFNLLLPNGIIHIASSTVTSGAGGATVTATLTGVNTNFVQGTTVVSAGADITPMNVTVNSPTSVTVDLVIGAGAETGPRSIIVSTGTEEAVLPNGFTVN